MEKERIEAEKLFAENQKREELRSQQKDVVTYRVQILSSMKSKGRYEISIGGRSYLTYEYFYKGEWRTTIGAFNNLEDAIQIQNKCRVSGYEQAFVAAFKNNERSLDISLFKR